MRYLDSAATTLKPKCVIDSLAEFYSKHGGSAGRGTNSLAFYASDLIEDTREKVLRFFTKSQNYQCIFTSSATDSINLLAQGLEFSMDNFEIRDGQNIVISEAEHHANILPWQELAKRKNLSLRYLKILNNGEIDVSNLENIVDNETAIISLTHCSNVTGIITQIRKFIENLSKIYFNNTKKPLLFLDVSQLVAHRKIDLDNYKFDNIEVDAICFSAHKIYGPNGVGVLIGKKSFLEKLQPARVGGGIVEDVNYNKTTYLPSPHKFESGSIDTAAIYGFGKALEYLENIGFDTIISHEKGLTKLLKDYFFKKDFADIDLIGSVFNENRLALASFSIKDIHPHEIGQYLDEKGVIVRTGHHCAALIHKAFKIPSSTRLSCGIYSNSSDIEYFFESLKSSVNFFKKHE